MKKGVYSRLAWPGIRKNWRLSLPYLLTCVGMTAMYYIVGFLGSSPVVAAMRGGDTLQGMLRLGGFVLGLFTFLFLFYTNSFLIRRRKKEFGLYNILGMGKRNLAKLLLWESAMIAAGSLAVGLLLGILLSKLGELGAASVLSSQAGYQLSVGWKPALETAGLFLLLHALILLNSLCHLSNIASACLCKPMSMVVICKLSVLSVLLYPIRWGAYCGNGRGFSGRGSSQARIKSVESIFPLFQSILRSLSLFCFRSSLFLPGCIMDGAFGRTAKVAVSAQESSAEGFPKYLHAAASSPTTLPPKGACAA